MKQFLNNQMYELHVCVLLYSVTGVRNIINERNNNKKLRKWKLQRSIEIFICKLLSRRNLSIVAKKRWRYKLKVCAQFPCLQFFLVAHSFVLNSSKILVVLAFRFHAWGLR